MMKDKFDAWSPSRINDYDLCPRKSMYKHLWHLCSKCFQGEVKGGFGRPMRCTNCSASFEPQLGVRVSAADRGEQIHDAIRDYISGKSDVWYEEMNAVVHILDKWREEYRNGTVRLEYELGLTDKWAATGFFDKDVWLRLKLDLVYFPRDAGEAVVIDWKSGKYKSADEIKGSYDDALNLYSVGVLSLALSSATNSFLVFTDYGEIVSRPKGNLSLMDLRHWQWFWEKRAEPLMNDTIFATNPGWHCRNCDFSNKRGGPCEF
jgi:hypothetical protein